MSNAHQEGAQGRCSICELCLLIVVKCWSSSACIRGTRRPPIFRLQHASSPSVHIWTTVFNSLVSAICEWLTTFYKSVSMELPFLLALMGVLRLTLATSSKNCTFDGITPSKKLTWCPCDNGFFCAKLDVRLLSLPILSYVLMYSRCRLITKILLLVELMFPWSNYPPKPILPMDHTKGRSF